MEKVLFTPDWQIPYQDNRTLGAILAYASVIKPDITVLGGDIFDFPYLTTKFLRTHADPQQLFKDLDTGRDWITAFKSFSGRIVFAEGNHEVRLRNYILERAPQLEAVVDEGGPLSMERLIGVDGLEYYGPYGEAFVHKGFVFKHGDAHSRYAAAKELEAEGSSGMSGHTHRFDMAARTDRRGEHAWWSVGCACYTKGAKMPPGYRQGNSRVRNQQQGFGLVYFDKGRFNAYPVVITNHSFISPEGERYA